MQTNDILDTTTEGIELIKHFEAFRAKWYRDMVGVWTIGYGTTEAMYKKLTGKLRQASDIIDERTATRLLVGALITVFEPVVERYVTVEINPTMFSAMVSFSYNVGAGAFTKSTLLKLLNQGRFAEAAEQFDRWTRAGGQVVNGLVRRRASEKAMFLRGLQELQQAKDVHRPPIAGMPMRPPDAL